MGGLHPKIIMTDQSFAMSSAISSVFPNSKHRLCVWHISENSKKHIRDLRNQDGFLDLFDHVLKLCHTIPEFDYYWNRLVTEYSCMNNDWLKKLYNIREKWCPAFSKDFFSAGILSSQRSESTNHALSRKVSATATLCDFYHFFCETVSEWRSHERSDNERCWEGFPEIAIPYVSLLYRASRVYTIDAYMLFEKEFIKSLSLKHEIRHSDGSSLRYLVYVPTDSVFPYFVLYDTSTDSASCTCKHFEEAGILCSHILRIYHIHCVENIPSCYILKRWSRNAKSFEESHIASCSRFPILPSVWRLQMQRKVHKILSSSDSNEVARALCEEAFNKLKVDVEAHVGSIYFSDTDSPHNGEVQISNPKGSRNKGERNVRRKSVREKKTNQARGRKQAVHRSASTCCAELPSSMACSSLLDT
ncbi:unnamed protein product [Cuscuta campestris]|uniref:SWIM-type domain-containing protein n=1 Tax=Cuscuta campestris TaxID=132261 RepID=A0A484N1W4_9ASTE|nr:unnamed protein product [Cuscuta campestris]